MRAVIGFLSIAICWAALNASATAAIVLSFGAPQTFNADSGVQQITVFASSTLGGGENIPTIGADFFLSRGTGTGTPVFNAPNAGLFGGTIVGGPDNGLARLGDGNINTTANASSFDRDTVDPSVGTLNLTFQNLNQAVTSAPTPLATLLINTNGLGTGSFNISAENGFFGANSIPTVSGTFNITAVPEPTSIALLTVAIGGVFGRKVLRRRTKKSA